MEKKDGRGEEAAEGKEDRKKERTEEKGRGGEAEREAAAEE